MASEVALFVPFRFLVDSDAVDGDATVVVCREVESKCVVLVVSLPRAELSLVAGATVGADFVVLGGELWYETDVSVRNSAVCTADTGHANVPVLHDLTAASFLFKVVGTQSGQSAL